MILGEAFHVLSCINNDITAGNVDAAWEGHIAVHDLLDALRHEGEECVIVGVLEDRPVFVLDL